MHSRFSNLPPPLAVLKNIANGIFMSKLLYGAETWAGAPKYIINKIQHIQLEAARTVIGPGSRRWSRTHLLKEMKWMGIEQIAQFCSARLTHKILTTSQLEVLAHRTISRIQSSRDTRLSGPYKLGPKPAGIGTTAASKYQYRANSYRHYEPIPLVIKKITKPHIFKKHLKRWIINNDDLPTIPDIPAIQPTSSQH